jgi:hypothetical protein
MEEKLKLGVVQARLCAPRVACARSTLSIGGQPEAVKAESISQVNHSEAEPLPARWSWAAVINSHELPTGTDMRFQPRIFERARSRYKNKPPLLPHHRPTRADSTARYRRDWVSAKQPSIFCCEIESSVFRSCLGSFAQPSHQEIATFAAKFFLSEHRDLARLATKVYNSQPSTPRRFFTKK